MIPLQLQFTSFDMPLNDVALLKKGSRLDVHFSLNDVRVTDCTEKCTFLADIELTKHNVLLRITGASKTHGD